MSRRLIGAGADRGTGIAVGADSSIYVTGYTFAADFPTAHAAQPAMQGADNFPDTFVLWLQPKTNTLIFSTYLGGIAGDESHALALDSQGTISIAGLTNSPDFPTLNPLQPAIGQGSCPSSTPRHCYDTFAARLSATGALVWSSFLGGSDDDRATALALDGTRGILIAGETEAGDFPMPAGSAQPQKAPKRDGFIVRIDAPGPADPPGRRWVYLPLVMGT